MKRRSLRRSRRSAALLALVLGMSSASVLAEAIDREVLDFFAGRYEVIGKKHDSSVTYSGTMRVAVHGDELVLDRRIGGVRDEGVAKLERRTPDKIKVLAAKFGQSGQSLEAACTIGSDLDNGPRLTCLVRAAGRPTDSPGYEAWFFRPAKAG